MTREEAKKEIEKVFVPEYANYIITALTEGATISDKALEKQPSEDCVSRTQAIEFVNEVIGGKNDFADAIRDGVEAVLSALPPVTPTQKWISVSERLPKSSGVYIVSRWFSDGEESEILTDANYYDGNGYWYNDNRINWGRDLVTDKIVAWMPLPEPYKVEMESEK